MPDFDLIVPTIKGREDSLARCLASFGDLVNPIIVPDPPNCGTGWLAGLEISRAPYTVLCADDIEADGDTWAEAAKETIDKGQLPAPIIHRPDGGLESAGGDMNAPACLLTDIAPDWSPVDFTPLPIVGRDQIEQIGMIRAHYYSDVWVSHRGRILGYETVLRHDYKLIHHHSNVGRLSPTREDEQIFNRAMEEANGA